MKILLIISLIVNIYLFIKYKKLKTQTIAIGKKMGDAQRDFLDPCLRTWTIKMYPEIIKHTVTVNEINEKE